ncbi:hypothetical protein Bca4012_064150 [Brassica carinata]
MVEIKEDQGSYRSCWMFLAIRDGEDQQQLNNDAKKAQIHDEAEEPEMFKAEDGRTKKKIKKDSLEEATKEWKKKKLGAQATEEEEEGNQHVQHGQQEVNDKDCLCNHKLHNKKKNKNWC